MNRREDPVIAEKRRAWRKGLCRWCLGTVAPPRRTFCSDPCVREWEVRSNPSVLRRLVFKRDGGVCSGCGADCHTLHRDLTVLSEKSAVEFLKRVGELGLERRVPRRALWSAIATLELAGRCDSVEMRSKRQFAGWEAAIRCLWEADHRVAFEEGGESTLDNAQTLCWRCHATKTAEHAGRRAARRRARP